MASDLAHLFKHLQRVEGNHYRLLVSLVIQRPDVEIQDVEKRNVDIFKSTSSSQKQRGLVNLKIFEEIHDCTFQDVKGFFDKSL
ncbi:hypothetical protein PABG_07425 [Paracoccidioides brasiliensis Pb03]|nr:hypothetical protein PABG_07425 [Paracoccidioides brasiliensis Pb03]